MPNAATALPREVEWQFDALDLRPVERFIVGITTRRAAFPGLELTAGTPKRLVDSYLDTADWRVGRAGRVFRVRRQARSTTATLKDLVESSDGLRNRLELEEPLASASLPVAGDGPVSSRVRALVGRNALRGVLEVRTRRRPYALTLSGETAGELVLDETAITAPGLRRPLHLRRVELELKDGAHPELGAFVTALREECGLQPAALSKFEAGLLAAGLEIPAPSLLAPLAIDASSTIGELAFAALRDDTNEIRRREPGTRLGDDPEELHKMRVATRRLRAAMALFEEALPVRALHLEDEVAWLARELGVVRDLDVQLIQLAAWRAETAPEDEAGLAELAATLDAARVEARRTLLEVLDSRRYARLLAGLNQLLTAAPPRRALPARTLCSIGLPDLLFARQQAAQRAARRARRSGVADDFHRLRIRCKRLRYALEFAARSYGTLPRRYTRQLAQLQDELGEMQDAVVAAERLREAALSGTGELSLGAVFAIGGIAERYRHEAERLLGRLSEESRVVNGVQWKRLAVAMERRRGEALATFERPRPRIAQTPPYGPGDSPRLSLLPSAPTAGGSPLPGPVPAER